MESNKNKSNNKSGVSTKSNKGGTLTVNNKLTTKTNNNNLKVEKKTETGITNTKFKAFTGNGQKVGTDDFDKSKKAMDEMINIYENLGKDSNSNTNK